MKIPTPHENWWVWPWFCIFALYKTQISRVLVFTLNGQYLQNKSKENENPEFFPMLDRIHLVMNWKCWHKSTHEFMKLRRFLFWKCISVLHWLFQSFCGPQRIRMQWRRTFLNSSNYSKRYRLILIYDTISLIQKHCHGVPFENSQLRIR